MKQKQEDNGCSGRTNDVQRRMRTLRLTVLAIATNLLSGCATAGFETVGVAACPPVVEYSREFQARAAEELALLPGGSAVLQMMGDYAAMRDQARSCQAHVEPASNICVVPKSPLPSKQQEVDQCGIGNPVG